MPYLLIHQTVQDYAIWKSIHDEQALTRRANGEQGVQLFRDAADSKVLTLVFRWDNPDRARLYAESDDLRETMIRSGVIGQPEIWLLDEIV